MDFHVNIEQNKYMGTFLQNYPQYEQEVTDTMYHKLPDIINFTQHMIKLQH